MAMSENSGYDMILHKILRYNMVPKRSAVFKDQHSKINVLFSLTPSHAFVCVRTPLAVVDGIRMLSITFSGVRTWGTIWYQKCRIDRFQSRLDRCRRPRSMAVAHHRTPSTTFDACKHGVFLVALLDFCSILTNIRMSSLSFEHR